MVSIVSSDDSRFPVDREVEIPNTSGSYVIENLSSGAWYRITLKSVNRYDKINPTSSPALNDQTGKSLFPVTNANLRSPN